MYLEEKPIKDSVYWRLCRAASSQSDINRFQQQDHIHEAAPPRPMSDETNMHFSGLEPVLTAPRPILSNDPKP